jgi:hypothetical protein
VPGTTRGCSICEAWRAESGEVWKLTMILNNYWCLALIWY